MKQYENMRHGTRDFPVGIHDTVCNTGFSLYPHIHREMELLVMTKGRGILYVEEEKYEIREGEGVFINSGKLHIGVKTDNEPAEFFAVVFAPEVFAPDNVKNKYVTPVQDGDIELESMLDGDVTELLHEIHKERENELVVRAKLYLIWEKMIKKAKATDRLHRNKNSDDIKKAMEYILNNYTEEISLEGIAMSANISKSYLCRKFSQFVHMTPIEYLNQVRIDKSCELLKNTNMSVGEIAERCGFNSFSYFSKMFREKTGITPIEYRK